MKRKMIPGLQIAAALLILLAVIQIARYGYARHLCAEIAQGEEIHTTAGDLTTAPVWCDRLFAILQTDGVKIPLVEACYYRNVQAVETLLHNGADPNFFIKGRWSALEAALVNSPAGPMDERSAAIVKMLIEAGADVTLHASDTPAIDQLASCMLPDSDVRESVFLLLLDNGAAVPSESEHLLHNVVRSGNAELARKMIKNYGFSANSVGYQGQTPLILAVYYSQYNLGASATEDMIRTLLACGADKEAADDSGKRAYDYAVAYGYQNIADYLK